MRLQSLVSILNWLMVLRRGGLYGRRSFTAVLAVLIVDATEAMETILDASVLLHSIAQSIQQVCALETHFTDATRETNLAEPERIVAFFYFSHSPLELDTFAPVSFFYRRR